MVHPITFVARISTILSWVGLVGITFLYVFRNKRDSPSVCSMHWAIPESLALSDRHIRTAALELL
jgi:hypothetical protein